MIGKHKFKVGQRVRPSADGIHASLFRGRRDISGVVTKVDRFNCPTIHWNDRMGTSTYHADFIEPDLRRRTPASRG